MKTLGRWVVRWLTMMFVTGVLLHLAWQAFLKALPYIAGFLALTLVLTGVVVRRWKERRR